MFGTSPYICNGSNVLASSINSSLVLVLENLPLDYLEQHKQWLLKQAEQTINQAVLQTLENANWKTHPARIPVENIKAPLLLLSGGQDTIWPATQMAQQICQQMQQTPDTNCTHIDYPEAGHLLHEQRIMGGSSAANAQANDASQEVIQTFLERVNN